MALSAASCRANNGVTCEWAPDGRHFLTATLAPRLRVDNGFQIFRWEVMPPCFAGGDSAARPVLPESSTVFCLTSAFGCSTEIQLGGDVARFVKSDSAKGCAAKEWFDSLFDKRHPTGPAYTYSCNPPSAAAASAPWLASRAMTRQGSVGRWALPARPSPSAVVRAAGKSA